MHKYHFVARGVAPKRAALKQAQEDLAETQRILDAAKNRLQEVEEGIATLQAKYDDCMRKKEELQTKTQECEARLVRADKVFISCKTVFSFILFQVHNSFSVAFQIVNIIQVAWTIEKKEKKTKQEWKTHLILCYLQLIGGLADEKDRWIESVDKLEQIIDNIIGDVLISSANIAYLGPFTVSAFSVISVG